MRRLSFTRLSPSEQPLVFLSLALIGGLIVAAYHHFSIQTWFAVAMAWWLTAAICLLNRRTAAVLFLFGGCFFTGGLLWAVNAANVGQTRVRTLFEQGELRADEPIEIVGTFEAAPELAPDRIYFSIAVERVATLGKERQASGTVQVVVPFNDEQARQEYDRLRLDYGAQVRLLGNLTNDRGYRNPGAPDFDEMLEHRGYDAAGWVKSPLLIERIGAGKRSAVLAWLYRLRARAIAASLRSFKQPASGILVAALFGNRHFLERDTAQLFRAGGTFHLLVISGLPAIGCSQFLRKREVSHFRRDCGARRHNSQPCFSCPLPASCPPPCKPCAAFLASMPFAVLKRKSSAISSAAVTPWF